jgi:putative salt-induced outer membrane protein
MTKLIATTAIALLLASQVHAQATGLTGVERLDDRIDDITEDAQDDLDASDDADRFSTNGVPQGVRGSAALQFSGTNGNTDTSELSAAARITYGIGEWSHSVGLAAEFGEGNGDRNEEKVFGVYEASRAFTPQLFAFGTGRFEYDDFATVERDAFLGGGLGYRIVNTSDVAWRVQGGPGIRYTDLQDGTDETEGAGILSSRFFYGLTDTISLTNDTDVLTSDINTLVTNDFGVNFRTTDTLSTRISYRTEYNDTPLPGFENADNTLGLSLVVGF